MKHVLNFLTRKQYPFYKWWISYSSESISCMSEVSSRTKIIMGLKINRNKKCIMKNKNVEWGRLFLFNYWIWVSFFQWLVYSLNVQYLFIWTTLSVEIMLENIQTCIVTIYLMAKCEMNFLFIIRNSTVGTSSAFFKDIWNNYHTTKKQSELQYMYSTTFREVRPHKNLDFMWDSSYFCDSFIPFPRCVCCRGLTRVTVVNFWNLMEQAMRKSME